MQESFRHLSSSKVADLNLSTEETPLDVLTVHQSVPPISLSIHDFDTFSDIKPI